MGRYAASKCRKLKLSCSCSMRSGMAETYRGALDEARRLLGNCGLFRGLNIDERAAIINRARIRNFAAGERIFSIGAPGDYMAALLTGTIRITVPSPHGRELLLAILEPGELFGEIALLDGKERSADATANTSSVLAILDRHEVLSFLERNPAAWPRIVEILCDRIRHTDIAAAARAARQGNLAHRQQRSEVGGRLQAFSCSADTTRSCQHGGRNTGNRQ